MRFWWVNHNQTFRQEFLGGYIWCPKKKLNGATNHFYETVREVAPGDLIFSYAQTRIQGYGIATTYCYSCPRPDEFGNVGDAWDMRGWRVDIDFKPYENPLRSIDISDLLAPFLPTQYSPIRKNGFGNQGAYLSEVSGSLAQLIANLNGTPLPALNSAHELAVSGYTTTSDKMPFSIQGWEDYQQRIIEASCIPETTRQALIQARLGQGLFKQRVSTIERACRITQVDNINHLIASHIKPWRESTDDERLSQGNGLLLTPSIDHLFDRGFITFADDGELVVSPIADVLSLNRMGVKTNQVVHVGEFNTDQQYFLDYHREEIFLRSAS